MTDSRIEEILSQQSQLESARSTFDSHWKEIAERILPRQDDFNSPGRVEGEKRTEKIFDSTAILALDRAASAIDSLITPSTQMYHRLDPEDESLANNREVRLYLDEFNKILFKMRYRPFANFQAQSHECYVGLMAFGTLGLFIDDIPGMGIRFKSIPMVELFIAENHAGAVDLVHRKFPMTARAAYQKWGEALPDNVKKYKDREPFRKLDFIHCVKPNMEVNPRRRDREGMAFSSYYCSVEGRAMVSEGGYRVMPYAVSRHVTAPRETYGRSPAMQVLPDIKMINEMEKTTIRAAHKIVDPPLLVYGDGILSAFSTRPGAMNYGGVDEQGRQLVAPLKTGSNLPIVFEMGEQKRKVINDAFYITLFQILVDNPRMTATEALIRAQEKGQLLAPTVGRQESEMIGPMIDREIDIIINAGIAPSPPPALIDSGGNVKVVHTSPLSRLRRAEDGVAISRTFEMLTPFINANPAILDNFDDDVMVQEIAEINGFPLKAIRPSEEVVAIREQRKQSETMMQEAQAAESMANTARNAAKAAETAGLIPAGNANI
jgi:hypothetical protein